ncbi:MAG TPA: riboflavin synthase [Longimicrobiales bacterium]|nr:riboflavin synthase [Longimicrobiales bacterium]
MFTGIVTAVGEVLRVEPLAQTRRIHIGTPPGYTDDMRDGDSVAVDGVCQTVVSHGVDSFIVEAIGTTLSRTTVGEFEPGRGVNLELALALGERLGGHLVQGHVDGTGRVLAIDRQDEYVLLDVSLPDNVAEVTVLHGSITVDGVSLTVNALPAPGRAQVALIPYTWENTNLGRLEVGSAVNLEGDMLGRFVVHHLKARSGDRA